MWPVQSYSQYLSNIRQCSLHLHKILGPTKGDAHRCSQCNQCNHCSHCSQLLSNIRQCGSAAVFLAARILHLNSDLESICYLYQCVVRHNRQLVSDVWSPNGVQQTDC